MGHVTRIADVCMCAAGVVVCCSVLQCVAVCQCVADVCMSHITDTITCVSKEGLIVKGDMTYSKESELLLVTCESCHTHDIFGRVMSHTLTTCES